MSNPPETEEIEIDDSIIRHRLKTPPTSTRKKRERDINPYTTDTIFNPTLDGPERKRLRQQKEVERRVGDYTNPRHILNFVGRQRAFAKQILLMKSKLNTASRGEQSPTETRILKRRHAERLKMISVEGKLGRVGDGRHLPRSAKWCWLQCTRRDVVQTLISFEMKERLKDLKKQVELGWYDMAEFHRLVTSMVHSGFGTEKERVDEEEEETDTETITE